MLKIKSMYKDLPAVSALEGLAAKHDREKGYIDPKMRNEYLSNRLAGIGKVMNPELVRNNELAKFIEAIDEAFVNIQNDLLSRGMVNCFPVYMIDQVWKLIQVRMGILVKDLSRS